MGLLTYKEGGYDRPEPKNPFLRFWYRYANRFFHLLRLNLLFFLVSLPFYAWAMTVYNTDVVQKGLKGLALLAAFTSYGLNRLPWPLVLALVVLSALCWGPAWAGLTYVAGKYANGEHAWAWADFISAARQNLRQAMMVGMGEALAIFVTLYYLLESDTLFGAFSGTARTLWFVLLAVYLACRTYLFPMMVSVSLPLAQILKNALILAFLKPLQAVLGVAIISMLAMLGYFADFLLMPLFAYAFYAFASSAIAGPVIGQYVVRAMDDGQSDILTNQDKGD